MRCIKLKPIIVKVIVTIIVAFHPVYAFKHHTVIIIGAGISGIAAAAELSKHHIDTVILEARNRIGGRIQTVKPWGKALDLGATWIHGVNNNPISRIAKQHAIPTIKTVYDDNKMFKKFNSFALYDEGGNKVDDLLFKRVVRQGGEFEKYVLAHTNTLNNISMQNSLERYVMSNHYKPINTSLFRYLINNAYIYEYATSLDQLSAGADFQYKQSNVSGDNVLFPEGYSQIIDILSKGLNIQLQQRVYKIDYKRHGVVVYTNKGAYTADYVIVTVPLGVLKSKAIKFIPLLPARKQEAINALQMGVYNKVYLHFPSVFWDKKVEWIGMQAASKNIWDIFNFYKFNQQPDLLVFTGGQLARSVENWSDQAIISTIMSKLKTIYGKNIPAPTSYVITRWNTDKFSRGSYSYQPVGVGNDIYQALAAPVSNKLFFAGEATSQTDPSTTHGAYLSGLRASREVLSRLPVQ